ncbi:MAG: hypothetical protein ACPGJU_08345 [Coraliomargarita sp.]
MSPTKYILTLTTCLAALLISGCASSEVVFEKGEPGQTTTTGNYGLSTTPHIVHVDMVERVATLRNGSELEEGFLIASNAEGTQTSVLKALPARGSSALLTADVLEGKPKINDTVRPASAAETSDLQKIYRDAE